MQMIVWLLFIGALACYLSFPEKAGGMSHSPDAGLLEDLLRSKVSAATKATVVYLHMQCAAPLAL